MTEPKTLEDGSVILKVTEGILSAAVITPSALLHSLSLTPGTRFWKRLVDYHFTIGSLLMQRGIRLLDSSQEPVQKHPRNTDCR